MDGEWKFVLGVLVSAVLLIVSTVFGVATLASRSLESYCHQYHRETGRQVKLSGGLFTRTCYVKTENGWFDIDQIREVR